MAQSSKINTMLNMLKGLACIGVVFTHIVFPGWCGKFVTIASAYAVPVFFMTAGYYAFGNGIDVMKRRLLKIIRIFIYGYALFFIYRVCAAAANHTLTLWFTENFTWNTPMKYLWFCIIDFAVPLWYLIAMIETYILWIFIVQKQKETQAIKFIPILFALKILLIPFCGLLNLPWYAQTNFVTSALPWFMTGYYFHTEKGKKCERISTYKLVITAVLGYVIVILPEVWDLPLKLSGVDNILCAFSLFLIALKYSDVSLCRPLEYIGSKLSLNIYILHVIIDDVICISFSRLFQMDVYGNVFLWCRPILVLITTMLVAQTINVLWDKLRHKSTVDSV